MSETATYPSRCQHGYLLCPLCDQEYFGTDDSRDRSGADDGRGHVYSDADPGL